MNAYLIIYLALSVPVTVHWYGTRLCRLALRTTNLLTEVKCRTTAAVRQRLRHFLTEDGDGVVTDSE
ncbi:hypothetical protein [Streptomyces exfoliatus]|uniref:hypothetical protein n=1 Tax=Streptomyces exfoliatus TaxID=1905 RepID=UPI0004674C23|nr:hypothetical protein [Streptomyces exfoliatus]